MSPVGKLCTADKCMIVVFGGLGTASTVAHEIGHFIGLSHDDLKTIGCTGAHIMRSYKSSDSETTWSSCSKDQLMKIIRIPKKIECVKKLETRRFSSMNSKFSNVQPEEQCESYEGYTYDKLAHKKNTCVGYCKKYASIRTFYFIKIVFGNGIKCAENKICKSGECVYIQPFLPFIDGGFGKWSAFGKCVQDCGLSISLRSRKCDNPLPSDGAKYCEGPFSQYKICKNPECRNEIYPLLEKQCLNKFGSEYAAYTTFYKTECKLYCQDRYTKGIIYSSDSEIGSPCKNLEKENGICIDQICTTVGCDGVFASGKVVDKCGLCGGDGNGCKFIKGSFNLKKKSGTLYEAGVIPKGASDIFLETKTSARHSFQYLYGGGILNTDGRTPQVYTKKLHDITFNQKLNYHSYGYKVTIKEKLSNDLHVNVFRNDYYTFAVYYKYTITT